MKIWIEYCEKFNPQQVYDIGANTGIYGLVAKALNPSTEVSFFEPIAKAVEILQLNLEMNRFTANVFSLALSNYDGVGHFSSCFSKGIVENVVILPPKEPFPSFQRLGVFSMATDLASIWVPKSNVELLLKLRKLERPVEYLASRPNSTKVPKTQCVIDLEKYRKLLI
jgi:hypothetical protein